MTREEALRAANILKEYCKSKKCNKCIFDTTICLNTGIESTPDSWNIESIEAKSRGNN